MIVKKQVDIIEIGLFELLLEIVKRKRFVFRFTIILSIITIIVCFLIPLKWESISLINPIADNDQNIEIDSFLENDLSELPLLKTQKMEMAIDFMTIMDSRTFREDIIRKYGFIEYFKITKPDTLKAMEIALYKLDKSIIKNTWDQQSNTIRITVTTKGQYKSKSIAEYMITKLEYYVKFKSRVKSKLTREFLEQRTKEIKLKIDTLMIANKKFESNGNVYSFDQQKTQILEIYSELVSKKVMNDIDLELARTQFEPLSPKVKELETRRDMLNKKISEYEENNTGELPKYLLNLNDLPETTLQYDKIQLDLKILNQIYEYIYPMFEAAKVAELKDMPAIEILDTPSLAGKPAKPKRLLIILVVTFAALMFSSLLSLLDAFMLQEQRDQLLQIRREFRNLRSKKIKKPCRQDTNNNVTL